MDRTASRVEVSCALCGQRIPYRVRFEERITSESIDFAAHKAPTQQHFRIVECCRCGLVYSNPILSAEEIANLYLRSPFIQEQQLDNMRRDYVAQLRQCLPYLGPRARLLEIGCSSGFFLQAALDLGFEDVAGVEPSEAAIAQAPASVRSKIIHGLFDGDLFPSESFDIVCCFQILDHFLDPVEVLRQARSLLREGGLILLINHNIRSWMPRMLGRRCPMYDIEHMYLFDKRTAATLLEKCGFDALRIENCANGYSLSYAAKMFPFPSWLKRIILKGLHWTGTEDWRIRLPAGNMVSVGRKLGSFTD